MFVCRLFSFHVFDEQKDVLILVFLEEIPARSPETDLPELAPSRAAHRAVLGENFARLWRPERTPQFGGETMTDRKHSPGYVEY